MFPFSGGKLSTWMGPLERDNLDDGLGPENQYF